MNLTNRKLILPVLLLLSVIIWQQFKTTPNLTIQPSQLTVQPDNPRSKTNSAIASQVQPKNQIESDIQRLTLCAESNDCIPNTAQQTEKDPYYAASDQLLQVANYIKENWHMYDVYEIETMAQELLKFPNSEVQKTALELLGKVPKNPDNLTLVIDTLQSHYDGNLVPIALNELSRYQDPSEVQAVEKYLYDALRTGSYGITTAISDNLHHFLNPQNINRFETLAAELPRNTTRSRSLRLAISSYRLDHLSLDGLKDPKP